ncbi:hypothetical protein NME78_07625 [Staphylococcus epidermidis]|nr:hypothetical protein [Staphylococcus epidermidis]
MSSLLLLRRQRKESK